MPTPKLTPATRYWARGVTKVYIVPTIADLTAPTRAELDAGTDITGDLADFEGWTTSSGEIDGPDMGDRWTSKYPGAIEAEESSLTLYASQEGEDARVLLAQDTETNVCWMDGGDTPGNKMGIYPVRVRSTSPLRSAPGTDELDRLQVGCSIVKRPAENVAVPAETP